MKPFRSLVLLALVFGLGAASAPAQGGSEAPLTNASVVKLVRAGFREKTVVAIIRARPVRFDLSPERLIELKKAGVGERVILAMLAREQSDALTAEGWGGDDDDFFNGRDGAQGGASQPNAGGVDIFGSSGGSSGRTRSNGGGTGGATDTQTTGSATVRILRPPTEAGGAAGAPKLERTPTLTNDSVVELVEAGFSEGTIIRRIEQSPVEFDLAPPKLEELRKHRVTEPVIAAMRSAMGAEGEPPARPER